MVNFLIVTAVIVSLAFAAALAIKRPPFQGMQRIGGQVLILGFAFLIELANIFYFASTNH